MRYIVTQETATPAMPIGGKARALAILRHADVPTPRWLVVTPDAFFESLSREQATRLAQEPHPETMRALLADFCLQPGVQQALQDALHRFFQPGARVAVRSSALEEDGATDSFAGQLQSFLFVPLPDVLPKILAVWRSGFTPAVLAYRQAKGLPPFPSLPAVLIQEMVDATVSGVAFGADPVSGDVNLTVISSLYGLGTALVSGECDADTFHWRAGEGRVHTHLAEKTQAARFAPEASEGVALQAVPAAWRNLPSLTDEQIATVADWVRYCGQVMGAPQDMEWAFAGDRLFILQARPVTSALQGDFGAYYYYWDDDDLDSWTGVTTPLTFSFIRRFYAGKFRHLSRWMGVAPDRIEADAAVYQRILGLIRGRIYYNISSLEDVWRAVPGFQRYRAQFNDWIGMADPPELPPPPAQTPWAHAREWAQMARTLLMLVWAYWRWPQALHTFEREVNQALALTAMDPSRLNMDRLAQKVRLLEGMLAREWAKPTINNFFASFFYTRLAKLTRDWCGDEDMTLRNNLLCGEGGIVSTRPVRMLEKLAGLALETPGLPEILTRQPLADIERAVNRAPRFEYHYRQYQLRYGERCHESSCLESPNIADEPLKLFRSIGHYAFRLAKSEPAQGEAAGAASLDVEQPAGRELAIRLQAETEVRNQLAGAPLRSWMFRWVLRQARARVKDRENIRFAQTRVMGRFRNLLLQLGARFQEKGLLTEAADVFYLEMEEVLAFVEGAATCTDLKALSALRKAEFSVYADTSAPPECFETRSSAHLGEITEIYTEDGVITVGAATEEDAPADSANWDGEEGCYGISCSPGLVAGPVAFVNGDTLPETLQGGEILVAELGNPGLVLLFPLASGLLFEKGSPLSHLSIVAREMGIPAIVSLPGLTHWLSPGDWVTLDGQTGQVRKLDAPPPQR